MFARTILVALLMAATPALAQLQQKGGAVPRPAPAPTGCKPSGTLKPGETVSWSGPCVNGLAEGRGVMQLFEGGNPAYRYEGDYKGGIKSGRGVLTYSTGARYEGDFARDNLNGQGTYRFPNGDVYVGSFEGGDFTAQGTYTWANGDRYVGLWSHDKAHGEGSKTVRDGRVYSGTWSNGCFQQGNTWATAGTTAEACGFR